MNGNWPIDFQRHALQILDSLAGVNYTPARENVLRIFDDDPRQIKVVILGQDPYPQPSKANGRAFAVNKGTSMPGSLQNIFKEVRQVTGTLVSNQTLESWSEQGVFLLNTALTTLENKSNAHQKEWRPFTTDVIKYLSTLDTNLIWVLWGKNAQSYKSFIKGVIIEDAHPSPLSAHLRDKNTFKILRKLCSIEW